MDTGALKASTSLDTSANMSSPNTNIGEAAELKRRSSTRSIKRRKFDDEVIDYNHPQVLSRPKAPPAPKVTPSEPTKSAKTKSETAKKSTPETATPQTSSTPAVATPVTSKPASKIFTPKIAIKSTSKSSSKKKKASKSSKATPKSTAKTTKTVVKTVSPQKATTTPKSTPKPAKVVSPKPSTSAEPPEEVSLPSPVLPPPPIKSPPIKSPPPPPKILPPFPTIPVSIIPKPQPIQSVVPKVAPKVPTTTPKPKLSTVHKPRPQKYKKQKHKQTYKHQYLKKGTARKSGTHRTNAKELGRWKPLDDLALLVGVQQTNDLKVVHRGTKFSCKFTLQEVQSRWHTLMYDQSLSLLAVAAIQNLHPEMIETVYAKALYSNQEEELLGTVKSTENPTLDTFQELLDKHPNVFFEARTPKQLFNYWQLLKSYNLLSDQTVQPFNKPDQIMSFSDAEEQILDSELNEQRDEDLEVELRLADRRSKQEIRHLENELSRWAVLVDSLNASGTPLITPEFDNQTLAVLRGRLVRYLMRSREISFGRNTKDNNVDVDLSLEGPSVQVSRKQGTIKLRSNGDFFISNDGKHAIFVDGNVVLPRHKTRLHNNSVLEVAGLKFVFLLNYDLINAIRVESAKLNMPIN